MEVKQIYELVNGATREVLGENDIVQENLGNLVDIGEAVFNANAVDGYVKSLVNRIGKVIFVNRPYSGSVPSVLMDGWEFGSVLEKIHADLPEATENESWELEDGATYDPNQFYKPTVSVKFFNKKTTFEIPMSFTERQVKQSFASAEQMNGFLSMLYNAVEKSMTVKVDALVMRTINNFIGETLYSEYPSADYGDKSGVRAVNLLYLYNQQFPTETPLTAAEALTSPDFMRFASMQIGLYVERLQKMSVLFNIGGKDRFTPRDMLHLVILAEFEKAQEAYLESDTFHNELVALPKHDTIAYWQGSGDDYAIAQTSGINIVTASNNAVEISGVMAVMFDHEALGVKNPDRRVTTNYNAKAEFYNNWYKADAEYFNDLNENFVVFFIADAE